MAISKNMLVHTVSVSRLADAGGVKKAVQVVIPSLAATVLPMSREAALANGIIAYKGFELYTNDHTLQENDIITHSGRKFIVKGVNPYGGFGGADHAQYVLEKAA